MKHPIFRLIRIFIMVPILTTLNLYFAHELKAAPGEGLFYGTNAGGDHLLTLNPTTGEGTVVGFMDAGGVPSLAVDHMTGKIYAGGGGSLPLVYEVDPNTGKATLIGDSGLGEAGIGAMDFSSEGILYASVNIAGGGGTGPDHLAMIDKETGAATIIGPFGECVDVTVPSDGGGECTIEGIAGIAFDSSGTLWGSLTARGAAGEPGLYTIDITTGAATLVVSIVDSLGSPPSGGVGSLQFSCDDTLYGGTPRAIGGASDGGRLITIDPITGLFTFVGEASAAGDESLGALAFKEPCRNRKLNPVDFSSEHNRRIQDRNALFPEGEVILGDIPFSIPVGDNNEWGSGDGLGGGFGNDGQFILDVDVGLFGVSNVYTLINTDWGIAESGRMLIEFFGSDGAYVQKDLIGDDDIRDWNLFPAFTTEINGDTTINVVEIPDGRDDNPDVMDMQLFELPEDFFDEALTAIRVTDNRKTLVHSGLVSGITIETLSSVVSDLVELNEDDLTTEFDPTPIANAPAGTFTITATFTNISAMTIQKPFFQVVELSGDNLLLNADGDPSGVGATLTPDVGSDNKMPPGEPIAVDFIIGLQSTERFRFFVDIQGMLGGK